MSQLAQKTFTQSRSAENFPQFNTAASANATSSSPVEEFFNTQSNTDFENSGAAQAGKFGTIQRKVDKIDRKADDSKIKRRSTKADALVLIDKFRANDAIPDPSTHFPGAHRIDIADTLKKNVSGEMSDCNQGNSNLCGIITPTRNFVIELDPVGYVQMVIDLYVSGESTYTYTDKRGKTKKKTLTPSSSVQNAAAQLNQEPGDDKKYAGPKDEMFIAENPPSTDAQVKSEKYPLYIPGHLKPNQTLIQHSTRYDPANANQKYLKDADAMFTISMLQKYPLNLRRRFSRRYKAGKENTRWGGSSMHSEKKMLEDFYGAQPVKKYGGNRLTRFNPANYADICNYAKLGHPVLLLVNSEALRNEVGKIVYSDSVPSKHWPDGVRKGDNVQLIEPMEKTIDDSFGTHWIQFEYNEKDQNFVYWEYSAQHLADETRMKKVIAGALIMPIVADE